MLVWIASCVKTVEERYGSEISDNQSIISPEDIISYADSIDLHQEGINRQVSLIYSRGNQSFYVERYLKQNRSVLYVEHSNGTENGSSTSNLYLIGEKPVMLVKSFINRRTNKARTERYIFTPGKTIADYKEAPYQDGLTPFSPLSAGSIDTEALLRKYEDAVDQKGDFDLNFEGIAEYPKARYLILSKPGYNTYRSAILLETRDEFINALAMSPEEYRGKKLLLDWRIRNDHEMIYISGKFRH